MYSFIQHSQNSRHEQHSRTGESEDVCRKKFQRLSELFCRLKNALPPQLDSTSANNPWKVEIIVIIPILQLEN